MPHHAARIRGGTRGHGRVRSGLLAAFFALVSASDHDATKPSLRRARSNSLNAALDAISQDIADLEVGGEVHTIGGYRHIATNGAQLLEFVEALQTDAGRARYEAEIEACRKHGNRRRAAAGRPAAALPRWRCAATSRN